MVRSNFGYGAHFGCVQACLFRSFYEVNILNFSGQVFGNFVSQSLPLIRLITKAAFAILGRAGRRDQFSKFLVPFSKFRLD